MKLSKIEHSVGDFVIKHINVIFMVVISVIAMVIRISQRDFVSGDMQTFLLPWFDQISENSRMGEGLAIQVGDYNSAYQTIIWLFTQLVRIVDFKISNIEMYLYKALSVLFDYLLAVLAFFITRDFAGGEIKTI